MASSVLGTVLILFATWYRVQLDVQINEWFGTFYDLLQTALSKPGSITVTQYWQQAGTFLHIAMIVLSWSTIIELISVYKRLRAFKARIRDEDAAPPADAVVPVNP